MRYLIKVWIFAIFLSSFLGAISPAISAPKYNLNLVTEDYPPLNMAGEKGHITGYATELLRLAAGKIDLDLNIKLLPWKRGYKIALRTPNTCIYSTWRTDERENLFHWVGPLATDAWSFFAHKDSSINIKSVQDTFHYTVGSVAGWGLTTYLQELGHPMMDLTPVDDQINARKLISKRIDLWATGRIAGRQLIKSQRYPGIREVFSIREIGLWVACNLETDQKILQELQAALDELEQKGTASKIRESF